MTRERERGGGGRKRDTPGERVGGREIQRERGRESYNEMRERGERYRELYNERDTSERERAIQRDRERERDTERKIQ